MTLNLCKCFDRKLFARRLAAALALTFLCSPLSGCFRVGLPEYFCEVGSASPAASALQPFRGRLQSALERSSPIAVVVTSSDNDDVKASSVGHQFLLGIFPFTRVFAQHGVSTFAEELAGRVLAERGYRVLFVPRETLGQTLFEVPVNLIVAPRPEVRVNAFDLLVVRLADVSGEVACDFYSPSSLGMMRTGKSAVEENEYRRQAQAPVLADLLSRSLRSGIENCLRQAPSLREARLDTARAEVATDTPTPIWIYAPEFSRPPAPTVGELVAGSYGYDSVPPFSYATLLRLIQKGAAAELKRASEPAVAMLSREVVRPPSRALRIMSDCLELTEKGSIKSCFRISEESSGSVTHTGRCEVEMPVPSGVDSALAVGLERSASEAIAAFMRLRQAESGSVRCQDAV